MKFFRLGFMVAVAAILMSLFMLAGCHDGNSPKPPTPPPPDPQPNLVATMSGVFYSDDDRCGDEDHIYQAVDVCVYNIGDGAATNVRIRNIEQQPGGLFAEVGCDDFIPFYTELLLVGNDCIGLWPATKPGLTYKIGSATVSFDGCPSQPIDDTNLNEWDGVNIGSLQPGQTVTVSYRYKLRRR